MLANRVTGAADIDVHSAAQLYISYSVLDSLDINPSSSPFHAPGPGAASSWSLGVGAVNIFFVFSA